MRLALEAARGAEAAGEVPVGAVLVQGDTVLAVAANRPIAGHDPTAHAEIEALRAGGKALGSYRLNGTTLYVTLEPCVMCASAIVHARVARLVFGAWDPKAGAAGSTTNVFTMPSHESSRGRVRRRSHGRERPVVERFLRVAAPRVGLTHPAVLHLRGDAIGGRVR